MSGDAWLSSDHLRSLERIGMQLIRPWTLCVIFVDNIGFVPRLIKNGRWLLDVDEDYISCSNPFYAECVAWLGPNVWDTLCTVYNPKLDALDHWTTLQNFLRGREYKRKPEATLSIPAGLGISVEVWKDFLNVCKSLDWGDGEVWGRANLINIDTLNTMGQAQTSAQDTPGGHKSHLKKSVTTPRGVMCLRTVSKICERCYLVLHGVVCHQNRGVSLANGSMNLASFGT